MRCCRRSLLAPESLDELPPRAEIRPRPCAHVGVLLVNLGTPDAATPAAVRRYLAEFLADPPRRRDSARCMAADPAWRVLRTRPAKSAARYAAIWTKDGSPLAMHTNKQKVLLSGYLGQRLKALGLPADHAVVEYGMRYGAAVDRLGARPAARGGCTRILVVPLYPQYASSTTGSVVDAVAAWATQARRVPGLRIDRHVPRRSGLHRRAGRAP